MERARDYRDPDGQVAHLPSLPSECPVSPIISLRVSQEIPHIASHEDTGHDDTVHAEVVQETSETQAVQDAVQTEASPKAILTEQASKNPSESEKQIEVPKYGKSRGQRLRRTVSRLWLLEFLSWFLALCFFAAVIGILAGFDGQSSPRWKYKITLGALVSVFASLGAALLLVPLGSAMGQLKWMWFLKERPVSDFETIDQASRGPIGSFWLLAKWKGGFIAAFGALLMITQLAIPPFVQQIIQYESVPRNITQASLPIAVTYGGANTTSGALIGGSLDTDLAMKAAIMNAALDISAKSSDFDVAPICPTGNCTWPLYQTLGICSTCVDITSKLETNDTTSTLPNGLSLLNNIYAGEGLLSMTVNPSIVAGAKFLSSVAFSKDRSVRALFDFFVIVGSANYTRDAETPAIASECLIDVCLQSFTSQSINGTFHEVPTKPPQILLQDPNAPVWTSGNFSFNSSWDSESLLYFLVLTFQGTVQQNIHDSPGGTNTFPNPVTQALYSALNGTSHSLDNLMGNVAKSMTRSIRTRPSAGLPVLGDAGTNQTIIRIEWAWISLPLTVLFAVLAVLIAVVILTRAKQVPKWKDESLATLFYGLNDESRRVAAEFDDSTDLNDVARGLLVTMRKRHGGWGLKQDGGA